MIAEVECAGLCVHGIESVNVHDSIKAGAPDRDQYIDAYIQTIQNLGQCGIHMVCYNFMPVFDWTRSDLAKPRPDGSTVLAYDQAKIDSIDPERLLESVQENANGAILPGWEPERLSRIRELFKLYASVSEEDLFQNLVYFLKAILPACEKYGVFMAIHPDDPAWSVFGLPRIVTNQAQITRLMRAVGFALQRRDALHRLAFLQSRKRYSRNHPFAQGANPVRSRAQYATERLSFVRGSRASVERRLAGYVCNHESVL